MRKHFRFEVFKTLSDYVKTTTYADKIRKAYWTSLKQLTQKGYLLPILNVEHLFFTLTLNS